MDIKQRIEATEVIRELAALKGENDRPKYVVVVEHDLRCWTTWRTTSTACTVSRGRMGW